MATRTHITPAPLLPKPVAREGTKPDIAVPLTASMADMPKAK